MIANKIKEILAAGFDADVALLKSGLTKEEVKALADTGFKLSRLQSPMEDSMVVGLRHEDLSQM